MKAFCICLALLLAAGTASVQAQSEKSEGCERAKEQLRNLESGQRIARTNPSGERYYMDENQVAQEIAKTQKSVQQDCK